MCMYYFKNILLPVGTIVENGCEGNIITKPSIFDNPKWVTCCNDSLGQVTLDKDYKVINVINDNYTIIMDTGIEGSLHKDRFYKVTYEDLLPEKDVSEDKDEGFDNLVYIEPKYISSNTYYVIEKSDVSSDQWKFLLNNLPTEKDCNGDKSLLNLDPTTRKWFDEGTKSELQDIYISFNDIFKHKSEI